MNRRRLGLLSGVGIGAGLTYLFDPETGRRRRALIRDQIVHAAHKTGDAIRVTSRDVANRTRGLVAEVQSQLSPEEVSDEVVAERVRAELGTLVRHPRAITVNAESGAVTLSGPVLSDEIDRLTRQVASVRGVKEVRNQLEVHEESGDVPGLQGEPSPKWGRASFPFLETNWSPTARLFAGLTGGAIGMYGLRRGGLLGATLGMAGLGFLARGLTNMDLKRLLGVGKDGQAITINKTMTISAPVKEVFDFWSHYENFPRFMSHVRAVRPSPEGRYRWTVSGPAGVPIEWETVVTQFTPNELIAWETLPGSVVQHSGSVRFSPSSNGGTMVQVRMAYTPPGGAMGHSVAALFGRHPKRAMDEDLNRLKSLIEYGKASVGNQTVTREEVSGELGMRVSRAEVPDPWTPEAWTERR